MSKKVFFPYLDSLRFVAFFLVFWHHGLAHVLSLLPAPPSFLSQIMQAWTETGGEGVHIFFVLSGFLITYLLVEEAKEFGSINIPHFYIRRILRIWPLYYFILINTLFVLPALIPSAFSHCHNPFLALTILENFDAIIALKNGCKNPAVSIAWSVAIEEQFYLLFPIYFSLLYGRVKLFYIISIGLIAGSLSFYFFNPDAYFHTFGNIGFLLIGAVGAYTINRNNDSLGIIPLFKKDKWFIGLGVLLIFSLRLLPAVAVPAYFLLPFGYLFLIVMACFDSNFLLKPFPFINKLGAYTYGMYFYHIVVIMLVKVAFDRLHLDYGKSPLLTLAVGTLSLVLTCVVAYLSYTYFEKRFLAYKNKFAAILTK